MAARLFDVTSGAVLFDGVDVRELDPEILWQRVGIVPQKAYLFAGTVASNLRYGKPDATEDEIWAALEVAQAANFVRAMPGELQAEIAQGGVNVSGGQRQRLAMARALVRKPEIYLFDDSFSALDLATDARLRAALVPYARDATVLIVAQRFSTIIHADQIIVLEDGEMVGLGNARGITPDVPDVRGDRGVPGRTGGARMSSPAEWLPAATSRPQQSSGQPGMRFGSFGMPTERSKDFGSTTRRLLRRLQAERGLVILSILMTVAGVSMSVTIPRILGHATDVIVDALFTRTAIDFSELGQTLGLACGLLVGAWVLQYTMAFILAGVVQRTMYGLRADVEEKLNRLPLSYVDRAHRGDLLSRVTNDIDNIAQTLQQTLSQLLTQVLMLVGTVAMMIWISWQLALVALVSIPISMLLMRAIAKRSRTRFVAQWRHTGDLNSQVEETFTGHAIVKGFGRQREVEEVFRATNDELYEASFSAQFISGIIQPATMFVGNLNFVAISVLGGVQVANGRD